MWIVSYTKLHNITTNIKHASCLGQTLIDGENSVFIILYIGVSSQLSQCR